MIQSKLFLDLHFSKTVLYIALIALKTLDLYDIMMLIRITKI